MCSLLPLLLLLLLLLLFPASERSAWWTGVAPSCVTSVGDVRPAGQQQHHTSSTHLVSVPISLICHDTPLADLLACAYN